MKWSIQSLFYHQIFKDFSEIDVDIYIAGCQGEQKISSGLWC